MVTVPYLLFGDALLPAKVVGELTREYHVSPC